MTCNCDLVVLATKKNFSILQIAIPYYKRNISFNHLWIVTSLENKKAVENLESASFFDENKVFDGLTIDAIQRILYSKIGNRERAGWYFQQLVKLAWSYRCEDACYIVIDADTIPLHPLTFIEDDKYMFTQKVEYNKPYFDTINNLFNGTVKREINGSFIAEHMVFDCAYVHEMLNIIMSNESISGNVFFEKILNAIKTDSLGKSGFSEFETYGNYMYKFHNDKVKIRKLRTQREALRILGDCPSQEQLEWAANSYDIISIESGKQPTKNFCVCLTKLNIIRHIISMKKVAKIRGKLRTIYRKINKIQDFKLEDN